MIAYIVTGFDLRETYWRDAEEEALRRAQKMYPRLAFEILEFVNDDKRPSFAMTSFRYRRYPNREAAEIARIKAAARRPDKNFEVRAIRVAAADDRAPLGAEGGR